MSVFIFVFIIFLQTFSVASLVCTQLAITGHSDTVDYLSSIHTNLDLQDIVSAFFLFSFLLGFYFICFMLRPNSTEILAFTSLHGMVSLKLSFR